MYYASMGGNGTAVVSLAVTVLVETNEEKKRTTIIITDMWCITLLYIIWLSAGIHIPIYIIIKPMYLIQL